METCGVPSQNDYYIFIHRHLGTFDTSSLGPLSCLASLYTSVWGISDIASCWQERSFVLVWRRSGAGFTLLPSSGTEQYLDLMPWVRGGDSLWSDYDRVQILA